MNERYPDGCFSHLYDAASNDEETRLGLSVPIPSPGSGLFGYRGDDELCSGFKGPSEAEHARPSLCCSALSADGEGVVAAVDILCGGLIVET